MIKALGVLAAACSLALTIWLAFTALYNDSGHTGIPMRYGVVPVHAIAAGIAFAALVYESGRVSRSGWLLLLCNGICIDGILFAVFLQASGILQEYSSWVGSGGVGRLPPPQDKNLQICIALGVLSAASVLVSWQLRRKRR